MGKEKYCDELMRLYEHWGTLTASSVVEEAAKETSPLHDYFEWDDSKAGHEYRLVQARRLLRVSVITSTNGTPRPVHVFVHVPSDDAGEGEYHPLSVVATKPKMWAKALEELQGKLTGAQVAVAELQAVAPKGKRRAVAKVKRTIETAKKQTEELRGNVP